MKDELYRIFSIKKIVKTKEVICPSCKSKRIKKRYTNVDLDNNRAFDTILNKIVDIDCFTDISEDYCLDCELCFCITDEEGYCYKIYFDDDINMKCGCGNGNICNDGGYSYILDIIEDGDLVIASQHCNNRRIGIRTCGIFGSIYNAAKVISEIAEVEVNKDNNI